MYVYTRVCINVAFIFFGNGHLERPLVKYCSRVMRLDEGRARTLTVTTLSDGYGGAGVVVAYR